MAPIADALKRKVAIEGLDKYVDEVIVPTEKVTEFKAGKKKIVERKLYPGYIVVHMAINDDTWFAVRETSGIGDFTGAGGKPSPMLPHEVARIVQTEEEESDEAPKLDIKFKSGDRVKVKDGTFEGFEGEVGTIDPQTPLAAPLHADLAGLPPLLIQASRHEALLDDANTLEQILLRACELPDIGQRVASEMFFVGRWLYAGGQVQKAMREKGIEYDKVIGGHGHPIKFLRKGDRNELEAATGQDKLPALKLADGTVLTPSKKILEWVNAQ